MNEPLLPGWSSGAGEPLRRTDEEVDPALLAELTAHIEALAGARGRVMIGICGPPGAGKSTLASRLQRSAADAVVVPMDGFHLASDVIAGTELAERRGAPDTFDVDGFVVLLERLRRHHDRTVYAPDYRRGLEDPVAAAIRIDPSHRAVLVEGNYLLSDRPGWNLIPDLLDEIWYLTVPDELRLRRLIARHQEHGMSAEDAERFALESDEANAREIASARGRADRVVVLHP